MPAFQAQLQRLPLGDNLEHMSLLYDYDSEEADECRNRRELGSEPIGLTSYEPLEYAPDNDLHSALLQ